MNETKQANIIEHVDEKPSAKLGLAWKAIQGPLALSIVSRLPASSRAGQKLAIAFSACIPNISLNMRDLSQASTQSKSCLEIKVYLRPRKKLNLDGDRVLLVKRHLYVIPDSDHHRFFTYHDHRIKIIGLAPTDRDNLFTLQTKWLRLRQICRALIR